MSFFRVGLTTPFYGGDNPAPTYGFGPSEFLGWLPQVKNTLVTIATSDGGSRKAQFDISIWDPMLQNLQNNWGIRAYEMFVYILYGHHEDPVFWGPIDTPEWDSEAEIVTLNCVDYSKKMQQHFFRRGDIPMLHSFKGVIPIGPTGFQDAIQAARNTTAEDDGWFPPLGIKDGTITSVDTTYTIGVERGQEVWQTMLDLQNNQLGPEFEIVPRKFDPTVPAYYDLNIKDTLGVDRTITTGPDDPVVFQDGFGAKNVKKTLWKPGGKIVNYVHAVDNAGYRVSVSDTVSAQYVGVWIDWDVAGFKVPRTTKGAAVLAARGNEILAAYSYPPDYAEITLKRPSELFDPKYHFSYRNHFDLSDTVATSISKGAMQASFASRITEVRLRQLEDSSEVQEEITVIPDKSRSRGIAAGEDQ